MLVVTTPTGTNGRPENTGRGEWPDREPSDDGEADSSSWPEAASLKRGNPSS